MTRFLIEHVDAITLDGDDLVRPDVAIAIEGGKISSVGPAPDGFDADEVIDGRGQVAMPGMFNAHCHAAMTLERGWAEDLPFDRWLNERIWVAESALEEEDVYWGASLAACEMIRAGVVGFADHYFWMHQVARVVEESGLKALLAWCLFGLGAEREVGGVELSDTVDFCRQWHGAADGRVRVALGPHSPYMCPPKFLRQVAEAAGEQGVGLHLHVAESDEQVKNSMTRHGLSPVAQLAELGIFDHAAIAAHCIAVDDADVATLAEKQVHVAHTPKTYMKLAMGMTPVQRLLDAGVPLALGTDGPASNSDLNLLEVLRLTGQLQKFIQQDAEALPLRLLLSMACGSGARALGFSDSGVLAPGAPADLVLLNTDAPHWWPGHDQAAAVVYSAHPSDVRHVMVDGRWLLRDGELTTLDEERIRHEARRRALRMTGQDMALVREYRS